ncbi:MAG: hypothetical protein KC680_00480 [Candidatus Peregrinibacteria bacterium]|nr:hypothetical protein [Candidatus Peregrinibacteria bacterium]MCB9807723.1 hypothetical protein [Candidatus Peribacteria bacterium]
MKVLRFAIDGLNGMGNAYNIIGDIRHASLMLLHSCEEEWINTVNAKVCAAELDRNMDMLERRTGFPTQERGLEYVETLMNDAGQYATENQQKRFADMQAFIRGSSS